MATEREMLDLLRKKFGKSQTFGGKTWRKYVIAEKVPQRPWVQPGDRIADAIIMDTGSTSYKELTVKEKAEKAHTFYGEGTQSIHGFEVKVSRSDWLSELRDPSKAESWAKHCHYFWLVVSDKSIVRDDLPEGWGLLVAGKAGLRVAKKPTRRDPLPMPPAMVVSLARASVKTGISLEDDEILETS